MQGTPLWVVVIIAVGWGAAMGPERLKYIAILFGGGYAIYWLLGYFKTQSDANRFTHLDGNYKIQIKDLTGHSNVVAEVAYRGAFDGAFDLEKIYSTDKPANDIWDSLPDAEVSKVNRQIREHFWNLRGHGPVYR